MTQATSAEKPIPVPDEASAEFFRGALAGKLMLVHCPACGNVMSPVAYPGFHQRVRCSRCLAGGLDWQASSGRATLYSVVLMHQPYHPAFAGDLPYNLALVETEEGVRIMSQVVDCPDDQLEVGMALEVVFERLSEAVAVPKFRPLS